MRNVDRGDYSKNNPYNDAPQGIGYGVTVRHKFNTPFD